MHVRVTDEATFRSKVYAGGYLLDHWPELLTTGMEAKLVKGMYYLLNKEGIRVGDEAAFIEAEMQFFTITLDKKEAIQAAKEFILREIPPAYKTAAIDRDPELIKQIAHKINALPKGTRHIVSKVIMTRKFGKLLKTIIDGGLQDIKELDFVDSLFPGSNLNPESLLSLM